MRLVSNNAAVEVAVKMMYNGINQASEAAFIGFRNSEPGATRDKFGSFHDRLSQMFKEASEIMREINNNGGI